MSEPVPGPSFINKYFTPEDRLAEVICGLIMVLSFTATTSATFEDTTPNALLIAVLGCNIAWGIVDGATYILGNLLNRGARARVIRALKANPDDPAAAAVVTSRLEAMLGDALTADQRAQVHRWMIEGAQRIDPGPTRVLKGDLYTGLACFIIVFCAALPVLLPFIFIENDATALRVCNGLILGMLFVYGWRWASFADMSRWKLGLSLLGVGFVLVMVTVILGG